jgi:hypothetical protein
MALAFMYACDISPPQPDSSSEPQASKAAIMALCIQHLDSQPLLKPAVDSPLQCEELMIQA